LLQLIRFYFLRYPENKNHHGRYSQGTHDDGSSILVEIAIKLTARVEDGIYLLFG